MPTLDVSILLVGQLHANHGESRLIKQPMTKDDWIEVHQDQEYTIQVNFNRLQMASQQKQQRRPSGGAASVIPKVHCPKFPKGKDEGWFLTLGDPFNGELLALKRCAYRNNRSSHQISFIAPNRIGEGDNCSIVQCYSLIHLFRFHSIFRSIDIHRLSDIRCVHRS